MFSVKSAGARAKRIIDLFASDAGKKFLLKLRAFYRFGIVQIKRLIFRLF